MKIIRTTPKVSQTNQTKIIRKKKSPATLKRTIPYKTPPLKNDSPPTNEEEFYSWLVKRFPGYTSDTLNLVVKYAKKVYLEEK